MRGGPSLKRMRRVVQACASWLEHAESGTYGSEGNEVSGQTVRPAKRLRYCSTSRSKAANLQTVDRSRPGHCQRVHNSPATTIARNLCAATVPMLPRLWD